MEEWEAEISSSLKLAWANCKVLDQSELLSKTLSQNEKEKCGGWKDCSEGERFAAFAENIGSVPNTHMVA